MSYPASDEHLSDDRIIELFWQRSENAIYETDVKYGRYIRVILFNILSDESDCEECQNDVYMALWDSIPPERPQTLPAYLSVLARNAAIDRYREKCRQKRVPSEMTVCIDELAEALEGASDTEREYESGELRGVINSFVRGLPKRRRDIFVFRYYYADTVKMIAETLSVSESTVKKELFKIKKQLKKAIEKHGFNV
ncbi:MAG: sigma-70 family RNA polymerase sigma factor [Clostridia bacterium]|nr:sigma-70 family RNA polymerase sigma factor [Clostridia bacterium]